MKIAIIGTGNMGGGLGRLLAARGHQITFGVRHAGGERVRALLDGIEADVEAAGIAEAVAGADLVVLAVPWSAAHEVIERAGELAGKILVDTTNPIAPGLELAVGHTTSAAEQIAAWAPAARVVKAFNTLGYEHLSNPTFGGETLDMFICGDDAQAKAAVSRLAAELGFGVVDAGPLRNARLLEPLALLWIRLARVEGAGRDIAFKLIRR